MLLMFSVVTVSACTSHKCTTGMLSVCFLVSDYDWMLHRLANEFPLLISLLYTHMKHDDRKLENQSFVAELTDRYAVQH